MCKSVISLGWPTVIGYLIFVVTSTLAIARLCLHRFTYIFVTSMVINMHQETGVLLEHSHVSLWRSIPANLRGLEERWD